MDLFIRPVEPGDAGELLRLMLQLQTESDTFVLANDLTDLDEKTEADNLLALQSTRNNILLAITDNQNNFYGVASATAIPGHPREAEVGVALVKKIQGIGLAQDLIDELIIWAQEYSTVETLSLIVQKRNVVARHIYEKYGFVQVAGSEMQVTDPDGEVVEAFEMKFEVGE